MRRIRTTIRRKTNSKNAKGKRIRITRRGRIIRLIRRMNIRRTIIRKIRRVGITLTIIRIII